MSKKQVTERHDAVDEILRDWHRERPELNVSTIGVFGRLARLVSRQRTIQDATYQKHGLTLASFDVLANLRRSGEVRGKTAGELAKSSMLTTGGITFRLDRMEDENLIVRVRTRQDRRLVYAQLTEHGKNVADLALEDHLETQRQMLQGLTPKEIEQLTVLLRKMELSLTDHEQKSRQDTASEF
ncbi:MarR family winged helix-turn-helix transcriptional regulator [Homoserinimonas sp. A447]